MLLLLAVGSVRAGPSPSINSADPAWCVPGEFVASWPVVAAAVEVSASYHGPVNDDDGLPKTNAAEAALEAAAGGDGCDEGGGGDHW